MSRLLVVSHTDHYREGERWHGWGPTVRELEAIAGAFDETVHICFAYPGPRPAAALAYVSGKVRICAVPPSGGTGLVCKLGIVTAWPRYIVTLMREMRVTDAVHIRAPANVSLLAMVLLAFARHPKRRWIKYAGNWRPEGPEPLSYRFQRWWLERNFARAKVTVNGQWPGQAPHVVTFPNPCLSDVQLQDARATASSKDLHSPVRLLFVGTLLPEKGAHIAVDAVQILRRSGIDAVLTLVGDGPARPEVENRARQQCAVGVVSFLGYLPHHTLFREFERAHFVVLPSRSEGWPKVLSEGMAHGAVPIASAVSSIPQVLTEAGCGRAVASFDPHAYADAILEYLREPGRWHREAEAGCAFAGRFTYEAHVERVKELLGLDEKS